jgi:ribonuclease P protein component
MTAFFQTIKKRQTFVILTKQGKRWVTPSFIIQYKAHTNPDEDDTLSVHLGITASKKVGHAVARNRAKRRLRALGRDVLPSFGQAGFYVLIARQAVVDMKYPQMVRDLKWALKRLEILR